MSNKPYKGFEPNWLLTPAPENSYRSIFRWGDPNFFKYPKESLYTLMKEKFQMTDDDFKAYSDDTGFDPVELPDHPWFVGVQFHPELKSRPNKAHPLFREFVRAAKEQEPRL